MAMTIHVDIVSAEGEIHSGTAEMVYAPGVMGELGIAPRHTPLVTQLKPGEVRVDTGKGDMDHYYVSGGILEIQPHVVTVLADTAVRAHDLDEAAAIEAKRRAEEAIANQTEEIEYTHAHAELADAMARLQTIERLRKARK